MHLFDNKSPIGALAHKLDVLVRGRLWLQVIISLILGLCVGIALGPDMQLLPPEKALIVGEWLAFPGELFLRLIKMVLVPLVFFSILRGLGTSNVKQLRSIGPKFALYLLFTTTIACVLGITLARALKPGSYVDLPNLTSVTDTASAVGNNNYSILQSLPKTILQIIPENPLAAAAQEEMLGIVIFALLFGIALTMQPNRKIKSILELTDGLLDILMTIVRWAMFLSPIAAFGLIARMAIQAGVNVIFGLGMYVATVLLGLLCLIVLYCVLIVIFTKRNPFTFLRNAAPVQLLAFSTSSSAAVMPVTIKTATEKMDTDPATTEIIVPLGTTVNMDGTALYQSVAVIFMAQVSGVDLSIGQMALVTVTLVGSSIGAPGTPGVGIAILLTIATNLGIPTAGYALLLGIDRLLDRFRTVINVTGDLTACMLFGSKKK